MTKLLTGYLILATAGATVDGRVIEEQWLEDIANNYNQDTYSAVINYEHYRYFGNLGLVNDVRLSKNAEGTTTLEGRLNPNHYLVQLNKDGQKLFTSIEVEPNFAATGSAYLVGLAVTDSPASLGTSQIKFSKHGTTTVFSQPIEFNVPMPDTDDDKFFKRLAQFFNRQDSEHPNFNNTQSTDPSEDDPMDKAQFTEFQQSLNTQFTEQTNAMVNAIKTGFAALTPEDSQTPDTSVDDEPAAPDANDFATLQKDHDALKTQFAELKTTLDALQEDVPGTAFTENTGGADDVAFV